VEKIRVTIERISKIITGIKNLARDGNQETYEKTTLNKIMDEVLQVWHCEGVRFEYKPCVAEVLLECRSAHIYQVMINLLNNARDAVSGLDEKWIALQVRDAGAAVEISITDSGHGIPAEIQDKIFLPFFTTKPTGKGSGLGLSIINKIVQAHQGTISIDKECPNTRFRILLPKTRSEAGEAAHE
jgi:C4-dicarboxylate-specific signal transduction histidine kinase